MTRHPKRYHCRYRRKCNLSILIFPFSPHEPIEICQSRASSTWRRHSVCAIPILPYFPCNSPSSLNSNSRLLSSPSPFPLLRFLPPFPVVTRPWRRQKRKGEWVRPSSVRIDPHSSSDNDTSVQPLGKQLTFGLGHLALRLTSLFLFSKKTNLHSSHGDTRLFASLALAHTRLSWGQQ